MTVAELKFEGEVEAWDDGVGWHMGTGPTIAGRDVIGEVEKFLGIEKWSHRAHPKVRVYLGIEPRPAPVAEGSYWAIHGWTGTDVTPGDSPEIVVGDIDLLDKLHDLDGEYVVLIIESLQ